LKRKKANTEKVLAFFIALFSIKPARSNPASIRRPGPASVIFRPIGPPLMAPTCRGKK
jgi:hypothetical protein